MLGNLVVAVFGPLYVLAVLIVGVGLAVVLAGIPLLALGLAGARRWGAAEARRAGLLDVWLDRIPPPPVRPGLSGWTIAHLTDASAWRVLLYLVAKLPTAATAFITARSAPYSVSDGRPSETETRAGGRCCPGHRPGRRDFRRRDGSSASRLGIRRVRRPGFCRTAPSQPFNSCRAMTMRCTWLVPS